jgi:hypothetical protein
MNKPEAEAVAREWIAAFNSHDVERIMAHYAESVELTSRLVTKVLVIRQARCTASLRCARTSRRRWRLRLT